MMRRYLAYCREVEPRIFRMFDLISWGAQGDGPVHLLLASAAEVGFAWDGDERGWVRSSLPPLRIGVIVFQLSWLWERVFGELSLFLRLFTAT